MKMVLRFLKDERGTETVEWAIVLGLIAVAAIATITAVGINVDRIFGVANTSLDTVQP
jgi:Flp pilus assembly pilin Flp